MAFPDLGGAAFVVPEPGAAHRLAEAALESSRREVSSFGDTYDHGMGFWVFFRATTTGQAAQILWIMFKFGTAGESVAGFRRYPWRP